MSAVGADEYEAGEVGGSSLVAGEIQRVTWVGCFIPAEFSNWTCKPDTTRVSTEVAVNEPNIKYNIFFSLPFQVSQYRHVAYDEFNEIFYFCDVSPGKAGLRCFAQPAGSQRYSELPRSVAALAGYSAKATHSHQFLDMKEPLGDSLHRLDVAM